MTTTAYLTHPDYEKHTLEGHPEHAGRIQAIWRTLEASGVLNDLLLLNPQPVSEAALKRVHAASLVELIRQVAGSGGGMTDPDTYVIPVSYDVALLSAGGVVGAVDAVLSGEADNALAVTRPPGHHATPMRAMGFCLFGNVAVAARHALDAYDSVKRVLIVDYDVHHGNGTQDIFYASPQVLFASTHQYPFYPGTGGRDHIGEGPGEGFTLNMPLSAGTGNEGFFALYERVLWPAARRYDPDLIIVSAGFDAHWVDPLAMLQLDLPGYAHLTRDLIDMADQFCGGRIVFALEGGYDLEALSHGVLNIAYALQGRDQISDPIGPVDYPSQSTDPLIADLLRIHHLE
jgi:acetoin utilization deacetylase AcuC-like enzyme